MKAIYIKTAGAIALTAAIAACVPSIDVPLLPPSDPLATTPTPAPAPTRAPAPVIQEPGYENYLDAPQTPGTWRYVNEPSESFALYSSGGEAANGTSYEKNDAIIRCDKQTGIIAIGRFGISSQNAAMRVRTETQAGSLNATVRESSLPLVAADIDARDPLLDAMAITKGRFVLETAGTPTLYLPAWVEVTRVIEDCR